MAAASGAVRRARPVTTRAQVVRAREAGDYRQLSLRAAGIAETARPGHFVALAIGDERSSMLLRRAFSIHRASQAPQGTGTVDVVVADAGPGTRWISSLAPGDEVGVLGPLGNPFPIPAAATPCVLVGGGYGSAPLFWLAQALRHKGCRVDLVLGAATDGRLFGVELGEQVADSTTVTTDDGTTGVQGRVTDVLPQVLRDGRADVVYACGPMPMLRAVTEVATSHGAVTHVAVEESMACGVGVCMTCVMPVIGDDGRTRMLRSCVEGPVFRGDRVRWDAWQVGIGHVPADTVGAPTGNGH